MCFVPDSAVADTGPADLNPDMLTVLSTQAVIWKATELRQWVMCPWLPKSLDWFSSQASLNLFPKTARREADAGVDFTEAKNESCEIFIRPSDFLSLGVQIWSQPTTTDVGWSSCANLTLWCQSMVLMLLVANPQLCWSFSIVWKLAMLHFLEAVLCLPFWYLLCNFLHSNTF